MQNKIFQIAIDGPVGAGKSTVAKVVADQLGIVYVDTGAMYRAVALYIQRLGEDWHDESKVSELVEQVKIELASPAEDERDGRNVTVLMDDEDVSWEVRKSDMGEGASVVSQYGAVRTRLVSMQRELARGTSVIMEGRDIGTKVLPDAAIKIYLDAKPAERAKRKVEQASKMGAEISYEDAKNDVETRDNREMNREIDPLRPASDAWMLDTTRLSIEEVVERIVEKAKSL